MFKKLKKIDKKIEAKKVELINTKETKYFEKFVQRSCREIERQKEIDSINLEIKQLLSRKHSILESLQQKMELLKLEISTFKKQINLDTYASA
jgi:IS1 family transposase